MRKQATAAGRVIQALVYLFLYAPIAILIIFSFNATKGRSWTGFSLQWYEKLFQNDSIMAALSTTLTVSVLAALIATVAGTFAAIGFFNMKRKPRMALLQVNNIPVINADIVTGVSLCLLFVASCAALNSFVGWLNATFGWSLKVDFGLGFGTLLIAHISFNIPYVILSVMPKLRQMDKNTFEAARDLGCTWMQAMVKVLLPEIRPGIVNGLIMAFTLSIDDFVISYFTAGSRVQTLSMHIYAMTKKRISPEINALSTLLFVTVLLLLVIVNVRQARQEKAAARSGR